jgi:hypothetical protein
MAKLSVWVGCWALLVCAACGSKQPGSAPAESPVPELRLSAETDAPALFLGAEPESPVVGFLGADVLLELAGPSQAGRVPVRIRGALWTRGFVPEELLVLRAQRAGRVRGTPLFLAPNDAVNVLGPGDKEGRLRVRAAPRIPGVKLAAIEGTFPAVGLAAERAASAEELPQGEAFELPAHTALALYDKPDGKKEFELAAAETPLPLRVLSNADGWAAVRVGTGPYLVGYTNAALVRSEGVRTPEPAAPAPSPGGLPTRLAKESGTLKRVAAGTKVSFGEKVIARLHDAGLARVLATYPSGEVDALIAVNDEVTVRGLVREADLSPYSAP